MPKFVHLHTHSHYSLLDGLAKIDELINRAKELEMPALALTDHGNVYGAVEFYKKAKTAGIKPILGMEAYVAPRRRQDKVYGIDNKYFHLTLICQNNVGWKNLIQLVTKSHLEGFYYKPRIDLELLEKHHDGLIALSGCYSGEVVRNIIANKPEEAELVARRQQEIFGRDNYFIEIGHHPGIDPENFQRVRQALIELSRQIGAPLAATQDIHYLAKSDAPYHEILLSVQTANRAGKEKKLTLKDDDFSMRSAGEMADCFQDIPEALENTLKIAASCSVEIELNKTVLPKFTVPAGETPISFLKKLVVEKSGGRYSPLTGEISERINFELNVIEKTGFADYFLIVQDFINWAKQRGVVAGPGRGSAAGSIVSYILGITNVDPLKYGLLFERFLNPDRVQMPDIDIDIADLRRDEVFGYLQEKYGKDHVAHIITFGTMAARAAVRDAGRALGMSYSFCDQIAKLIPFNADLKTALENVPELKDLYQNNQNANQVVTAAQRLEGVARHASVHACGIVIADKPLTEYLPLQYAPQDENTTITQFEMHAVEDLGLLKMDILGLKNLTIIEEAVRLIQEGGKGRVDIDRIPLNDQKTYAMLQRGDTTGVFQFEGSGIRRFMKELKPTELEDLIALVSAYRPGPIELIPSFIKRKHGQEPVQYLHPRLEPIMKNTYGIGIYQEQMMRIARDLAGFTLAEADTLRKAIGKKIKSLMDEQKEKLISGMINNGISQLVAQAIWELFPSFARYGFNRCLTGDTKIHNPITGEIHTIQNLYNGKSRARKTISLSQDQKIFANRIKVIVSNGKKNVYQLITKSGRRIKTTANHPFLTPNGWQILEKVSAGDKIAVPRKLPEPLKPLDIPGYQLAALGYLLAEGNFCHPNGFYFYSRSEEEIRDYLRYLEQFENTIGRLDYSKSAIAVYSKRKNIKRPSAAVEWINSLGLRGKKAVDKFLPDLIFQLSNDQLAVLIAKMFQGDGCINNKGNFPQIFYATSSVQMAEGLQCLLLRFGILSSIHTKRFKYRGDFRIGYTITISRYDNIGRLLSCCLPYLVGQKRIAAEQILADHPIINQTIKSWSARGSRDIVPVNIARPLIREAVGAASLSFANASRHYNFASSLLYQDIKKIGYLRETVSYLAGQLKSDKLKTLAESDIYWDEIVSIRFVGNEEVFDLTMEGEHNFIANNIFVHNSHGACYALIGYQTAYLRANYPVELMTALLNADAGDTERVAFLVGECQRMGINVGPPDINQSWLSFTPEGGNIRFGLLAIKNVGRNIVEAIIAERQKNGPYKKLSDLLMRVNHKDLNKKSLESLMKCGAFDSVGLERNHAAVNIDEIIKFAGLIRKERQSRQDGLFGGQLIGRLNLKEVTPADTAAKLAWEKELLGLYISDHPLNAYKEKLTGVKPIKEALTVKLETITFNIGGLITRVQKINTRQGKPMAFVSVEDFTGALELVVFPDIYGQTSSLWQEGGVILARGRMSWRGNEPRFICGDARIL